MGIILVNPIEARRPISRRDRGIYKRQRLSRKFMDGLLAHAVTIRTHVATKSARALLY
jgi:hypothetical protein